jgi:hypothetical protein
MAIKFSRKDRRDWERYHRTAHAIGGDLGQLLLGDCTSGEGEQTQENLANVLRYCGWICTPPAEVAAELRKLRQKGKG